MPPKAKSARSSGKSRADTVSDDETERHNVKSAKTPRPSVINKPHSIKHRVKGLPRSKSSASSVTSSPENDITPRKKRSHKYSPSKLIESMTTDDSDEEIDDKKKKTIKKTVIKKTIKKGGKAVTLPDPDDDYERIIHKSTTINGKKAKQIVIVKKSKRKAKTLDPAEKPPEKKVESTPKKGKKRPRKKVVKRIIRKIIKKGKTQDTEVEEPPPTIIKVPKRRKRTTKQTIVTVVKLKSKSKTLDPEQTTKTPKKKRGKRRTKSAAVAKTLEPESTPKKGKKRGIKRRTSAPVSMDSVPTPKKARKSPRKKVVKKVKKPVAKSILVDESSDGEIDEEFMRKYLQHPVRRKHTVPVERIVKEVIMITNEKGEDEPIMQEKTVIDEYYSDDELEMHYADLDMSKFENQPLKFAINQPVEEKVEEIKVDFDAMFAKMKDIKSKVEDKEIHVDDSRIPQYLKSTVSGLDTTPISVQEVTQQTIPTDDQAKNANLNINPIALVYSNNFMATDFTLQCAMEALQKKVIVPQLLQSMHADPILARVTLQTGTRIAQELTQVPRLAVQKRTRSLGVKAELFG